MKFFDKNLSYWRELNSRPLPYQGSALPLSYNSISLPLSVRITRLIFEIAKIHLFFDSAISFDFFLKNYLFY